MTPFMLRVADYIGATEDEVEDYPTPMPATRITQRIAAGS